MIRLPAEWEPHEGTAMCWPARQASWGEMYGEAERAWATVANTIARFEPLTMLAPGRLAERAGELLDDAVDIIPIEIDDCWFRDSGPIYVTDGTERIATDWTFNSWGEKFLPFADDALAAQRFAAHRGDTVRTIDMVLEGGSVSTDGEGALVTTIQCLLHPNRNPTMTQAEIDARLRAEFGVGEIIWLPYGLALDWDTDGHVDNVGAFTPGGKLLLQGCNDPNEADFVRMNVNRRVAADARDVVEVPILPFIEIDGERSAVPYLNYYVGNGFVLVPTCGHDADDDMVSIIAEHFPGRETIALEVGGTIAHFGGGIHCITQQIPRL